MFDIVLTQFHILDIVLGAHNTMSDIGPRQYQYLASFNDCMFVLVLRVN